MKDFVFRERRNQRLDFAGDIGKYYLYSRSRLVAVIRDYAKQEKACGLEIGCGHGHVLNLLAELNGRFASWCGMDLSVTAIEQARTLFPERSFIVGDITKPLTSKRQFDVVILGQVLWYVMHEMHTVLVNCHELLNDGGILVISQAFL